MALKCGIAKLALLRSTQLLNLHVRLWPIAAMLRSKTTSSRDNSLPANMRFSRWVQRHAGG